MSKADSKTPIVTGENAPKSLPQTQKSAHISDIRLRLFTKEQLLATMKQAGGKNLTSTQFALMITPRIKESASRFEHDKWDLALNYIRNLMRKLAKEGKISINRSSPTNCVVYRYTVIDENV